ncbi:MAG TPA: SulP family inorganic anion transporter [Alphaproteobacteria bacterium]|jgi:SulP family sulfate permease|nr:SulP family inorganic anion transporter [Alphaproteobacteria bacterium]
MATSPPSPSTPGPAWHLFVPKLITILRQGYSLDWFRHDLVSGLTVAIVALPLAMALAIASGATPDKGLLTAVIAGFLISALGGSRFQIGGPTGAFVVVVFGVIREHGYDGLILATLMAGAMLIAAGVARLGTWIKYIPEPVVTGFTSGIAVIIFTSQIQDLFGLVIADVPAAFFAKWPAFWAARDTVNPSNIAIAGGSLAIIVLLRRFAPKAPGFLVAIIFGAAATSALGLHIDTIASRFGGLNGSIPMPHFPDVTFAKIGELLPSAFTIAFLAGVESLLSAVVADGMTGRRHRSNCELVAQGVANAASALFGGLPATGAIARTATNIRSGARSPVSGMLHAVFVLLFMVALAPLADYIPLASLAAVLVIVAWNMSEIDRFRHLMRAPWGDRLVLLLTFGLTVAVDLTFAIEVGVVLAAVLFMHRMAEVVRGSMGTVIETDIDDFTRPANDVYSQRSDLPSNVEVFQFRGPLFFGAAELLTEVLDRIAGAPRAFILRMSQVQMIDATGASRLRDFIDGCHRRGTALILSGLQPQPTAVLTDMHILSANGIRIAKTYGEAVALAREIAGGGGSPDAPTAQGQAS